MQLFLILLTAKLFIFGRGKSRQLLEDFSEIHRRIEIQLVAYLAYRIISVLQIFDGFPYSELVSIVDGRAFHFVAEFVIKS